MFQELFRAAQRGGGTTRGMGGMGGMGGHPGFQQQGFQQQAQVQNQESEVFQRNGVSTTYPKHPLDYVDGAQDKHLCGPR